MTEFDQNTDFQAGKVLLFNKDSTWSSFDVVNKIRYLLRSRFGIKKIKVGHAGTLDPLATGLLIICTGKATKQIYQFQDMEKEYVTTFELGRTTPSFDLELETDATYPFEHITKEDVEKVLSTFKGTIQQIPPVFSAVKFKGKSAYKFARKGEDIKLEPKTITIDEIELLDYQLPKIKFKVVCSKGTYIRALARDVGEKLGCGATMIALERTRIGDFKLDDSVSIEIFQKKIGYL